MRVLVGLFCKDVFVVMECVMIFGVDLNVFKCEVKIVYCKLVLRFYFDVCKGGKCEIDFMKVNRVYEIFIFFFLCGDGLILC